ncbi:MAG TPA: hypothetical protein VOB72_01535 [Candidatus Dormibacteraeota bacterium]|nr:hypothetical protein [Candidatus Dormibacteraeota bacterium]
MSEREWPTIEEQLASDGIRRGTALERLVREHQDFDLLRPEEAHDRIGLPPWLRVYWRRQHPDSAHRTGDPTGGYPRALRTLHRWMVAHQDLPAPRPDESTEDAER